MWGNALGWKISAVILLVAFGGALWLGEQMQITAPTSLSLNPQNLAKLSPPSPPWPIVDQSRPGDAGDEYRQAIAEYPDAADACEKFAGDPAGGPPDPMRLILDAAGKSDMNLFAKDPGQIVDYQVDHPPLDDLGKLAQQMDSAALLLARQKKLDEARRYYQAVYALGFRLYRERVDYDEYVKGMGLMDAATTGLAECEPENSPRREQLEQLEPAMVAFDKDHVLPIYQVLSSADQRVIARNAGDVFRFADKSQERMFRVEAILKLGRYRFDADRKADQLAVARSLRQFLLDPDPVIRAAATAAGDLTLEQYRMIH